MVPEDFVRFTEKCMTKELPKVEIDIKVTVDGEESRHSKDILSSFEKKMKDEIQMKLLLKYSKTDRE